MRKIEFQQDGYEIVVNILNANSGELMLEADAYYKDFENYKIYILATTEENLLQMATHELLSNHPFEKIILNYDVH